MIFNTLDIRFQFSRYRCVVVSPKLLLPIIVAKQGNREINASSSPDSFDTAGSTERSGVNYFRHMRPFRAAVPLNLFERLGYACEH